jgi:transposase
MRKSINGLAQVVSGELERNPCDGGLFVFLSKNRRVMKCLYWDRTGFALWQKRLEKDRFRWPVGTAQEVLAISSEQMDWLLAGLDILKTKPHAELRFEAFS